MLIKFSPRKQNLTLYIIHNNNNNQKLLTKLKKHTTNKNISNNYLYINKLSNINLKIL